MPFYQKKIGSSAADDLRFPFGKLASTKVNACCAMIFPSGISNPCPPVPGRARITGLTEEARRAHGLFRFYVEYRSLGKTL